MSHSVASRIVLAVTAFTLSACVSPTAPAASRTAHHVNAPGMSADCGGGVIAGSDGRC